MSFYDNDDEERVIGRTRQFEDRDEKTLRPITFEEYSGQDKIKTNLKIFINSAKKREERGTERNHHREKNKDR